MSQTNQPSVTTTTTSNVVDGIGYRKSIQVRSHKKLCFILIVAVLAIIFAQPVVGESEKADVFSSILNRFRLAVDSLTGGSSVDVEPYDDDPTSTVGLGGELHQHHIPPLTTNQGLRIEDDENSFKANSRGPTLLEDFILRDKITHFDNERIPERVVHARGMGAHGVFEVTDGFLSQYSKAKFLQLGSKCDVFVRFSTVAGPKGSADLVRDVRGFATRFYTTEGNFDLVGNNIPVFFIQDAMKFPDLIHAAKEEPDRGFPTAATAHHNFWDFISLMPESMHMIMWAMSDRAIPRGFRFMEGFGVNTFRLVDLNGNSTFVKFHWKPRLGLQSVIWDEAVKINGADPDYHRRDLWEAINSGLYPEWDFGVQILTPEALERFEFDVFDATKLIPEEIIPVQIVGKMTLNKNVENFFAETEQVAFHPGNIVPGIDFSNDPLLQGRLFSYLDTQLLRLGGPNFHEIPINRPKCPWRNLQQDGLMRIEVPTGRINYSPNSDGITLQMGDADLSRQTFSGLQRDESGITIRARPDSFKDHYSQAKLFYLSQLQFERDHIVMALITELSNVDKPLVRQRIVSHLLNIDVQLATRVAHGLGIDILSVQPAPTIVEAFNITYLCPSLSIYTLKPVIESSSSSTGGQGGSFGSSTGVNGGGEVSSTGTIIEGSSGASGFFGDENMTPLTGRKIACLVDEGSDLSLINDLRTSILDAGAQFVMLGLTLQGNGIQTTGTNTNLTFIKPDLLVTAKPSALFDSVLVLLSQSGESYLEFESLALSWVLDAFNHLKIIGYNDFSRPFLLKAGVPLDSYSDEGLIELTNSTQLSSFVQVCKKHKIWEREARVRIIP